MRTEKARELFSEYREGTLEDGLKAAFEAELRRTPELDLEYREFSSVLNLLEATSAETPEAPFDLYDRVTARLDQAALQARRTQKRGWLVALRPALLGGVAVLALVGAVLSFNGGKSPVSSSSFVPMGSSSPAMTVVDGQLRVRLGAAVSAILVKEHATGRLVAKIESNGRPVDQAVVNQESSANLFDIDLDGGPATLVALPGTAHATVRSGRSSLGDLAVALAGLFREPVVVGVRNPDAFVAWFVPEGEPTFSGPGYTVERRAGMLYLTD